MRHSYQHLLTLGLLLCGAAAAQGQALYNNGATITVSPGATLYVQGGYQQTSGSTLKTDGTTRVDGDVQSAGTVDLGTGELEAKGHVTNSGTTQAGAGGTLRLTGTTNQNVDLAGGTVSNLVVNKSTASNDTVRVVSNLNVTGGLTMTDGMVRTRTTTRIDLANGATVTGEASGQYVQGNLRVTRTGVTGASPVDFGNGAVINPNGNNLGSVVVTRSAGLKVLDLTYGQNPNNATYKSIDRIWAIQPTTQPAPGVPASLTMSWLPDNDNGLTLADFASAAAWKRTNSAAPWVPASTYTNATSRTLTVAAASFSDWTVGAQSAPLPVELLAFTARRAGDAAQLDWATASERNNLHFDVEMSLNGRDFRKVGEVAGQGTTSQQHEYRFFDRQLLTYHAELVYYRLRQVDRDGREVTTPIERVRVDLKHEFTATAWPNPFDGTSGVQVQVHTTTSGPVELSLFDAVGRLVSSYTTLAEPGATLVPMAGLDNLATGVYLLKVRQGQDMEVIRLTRQ